MNTNKRDNSSDRRAAKLLWQKPALLTLFKTSRNPVDYRDGFVMGYFFGKMHGVFEGKWHERESRIRRIS